jgi:uncharacterized protein
MKYLLVIVVVGFVLWLMFGRGRGTGAKGRPPAGTAAQPVPVIGCAHCGLHLPQTEAVADASGRWYCGDAHRLAGPR